MIFRIFSFTFGIACISLGILAQLCAIAHGEPNALAMLVFVCIFSGGVTIVVAVLPSVQRYLYK